MEKRTVLTGLVFCWMICLTACRPQYDYNKVGLNTVALPGLPLNTGSLSSLPSSYNPGLLQGPISILPSQALSQSYLPPLQQSLLPLQQPLLPTLSSLPAGQQFFQDISQLPLQNQNSFSSIPAESIFNGLSQSLPSPSLNLNQQISLPQQQRTIVTKEIYIHTAPQDADDNIDLRRQLESIPIRKNYRILFIKAPTQNLRVTAEALKRAQASSEERTVIYVLSKKADVSDLQKQLTQVQGSQTVNRKPEVYFIKYKTNEEAQRAQQQIQAQYDALGGTTNISDEGVAPLTSVVGALDRDNNISTSGTGQSASISIPSKTYLPPAKV